MTKMIVDQTQSAKLATIVSGIIAPSTSIGLVGDLGGGKTTFTRHLAESLGVRCPVSSPTFVLSQEYPCKDGLTIEHWDLYRLNTVPEELYDPVQSNYIRVIEWVDKFPVLMETCAIILSFNSVGDEGDKRRIEFRGPLADSVLKAFCDGGSAA